VLYPFVITSAYRTGSFDDERGFRNTQLSFFTPGMLCVSLYPPKAFS